MTRELTLRRIVDEPSGTSLSNGRETEVVERLVGSEEDVSLLGRDLRNEKKESQSRETKASVLSRRLLQNSRLACSPQWAL